MWTWYKMTVTLMFVLGFALIIGSLTYLIFGLEKIDGNYSQDTKLTSSIQSESNGHFQPPLLHFSDTGREWQDKGNNTTDEGTFVVDSEAVINAGVGAETQTVSSPSSDSQEPFTNVDSSVKETSNAHELYLQQLGNQAMTQLPGLISEWLQMTNEYSALTWILPLEEVHRRLPGYFEKRQQMEDDMLRLAAYYIAATDDVETLNAMFEETIWSFD